MLRSDVNVIKGVTAIINRQNTKPVHRLPSL